MYIRLLFFYIIIIFLPQKRLSEEREQRLKKLSNKINAAQAAKAPERSTKLAYVAGALRGGHMRKPKANGFNLTGEKKKELMGLWFFIHTRI